ncbi:Protein RALF-like 34 [Bienertia sinuspersici]
MWSKFLSKFPLFFFFFLLIIISFTAFDNPPTAEAQIQDFGFEWSSSSTSPAMLSMIESDQDLDDILDHDNDDDEDESSSSELRRSLYWKKRYYISYGALKANRVPCPPRSGRSYYTHNCFNTRAPANPYFRGCSCIARCRR